MYFHHQSVVALLPISCQAIYNHAVRTMIFRWRSLNREHDKQNELHVNYAEYASLEEAEAMKSLTARCTPECTSPHCISKLGSI